jgi:hypothetical protein
MVALVLAGRVLQSTTHSLKHFVKRSLLLLLFLSLFILKKANLNWFKLAKLAKLI